MIMINKPTFIWFKQLSNNRNFIETISLSDRLFEEQYPMELVLRHVALVHYEYSPKKELSDFFDDIVEQILIDQTFNYEEIETKFNQTFEIINNLFGENSFKRFDGNIFKGKFLESAFEAISIGIAANFESYSIPADNDFLKSKISKLHSEQIFQRYTGSGSNARTRIPKIIPFAIEYFKK